MKIKVKVTAADIANGERGMCGKCPVALAIERAGGKEPLVYTTFTSYRLWGRRRVFNLPREAKLFITYFDCGYPVKPFEFELYFNA